MPDRDLFSRQCSLLRLAATGVLVSLALLLALIYLFLPVRSLVDGSPVVAAWRNLWVALVHLSPGACYLWSLWAVRRALGDLGRGRLFHSAVTRALRQVGYGVVAGALLNLFAVTNLSRIILHTRGSFAYFDLSGVVLAIVGGALVLLAAVMDQARALQCELDEIV